MKSPYKPLWSLDLLEPKSNRVAIVILTMDRPDFVMRQLAYYNKVYCEHPIYIGDASKDKKKLQNFLDNLNLTINYYPQPAGMSKLDSNNDLQTKIKEDYAIYPGDDDFVIPESLTKCAEFLENHPDYSSASGHILTFRTDGRISKYPVKQIESSTASQRLLDLMSNFFITEFSVQRTKLMPECRAFGKIKDPQFAHDMFSSAISLIQGKSKVLDCLSFVKQLDTGISPYSDTFNWVTSENWQSSYELFCTTLAKHVPKKTVEQAVWNYLNIWMPYDYKKKYGYKRQNRIIRKLRFLLSSRPKYLVEALNIINRK